MKPLVFASAAAAALLSVSGGAQTDPTMSAPAPVANFELQQVALPAEPGIDELWRLADSAEQAMASADYKDAARLFDRVIEAADFDKLDTDTKSFILSSAAKIASMRTDFGRAQALYARSSQHGLASAEDWMGRLNASWFLGDYDDAIQSLSYIADSWPEELAYVSEWAMDSLLRYLRDRSTEAELKVLRTLFATGWQTDLGLEPTNFWLRLIELLNERKATGEALAVASRLRDPLAVVALRADQRFAELIAAQPEWFSIQETIDAGIIEARLAVEANPGLLAPAVRLGQALLHAGRAQDALLVVNTHMARSALKSVIGDQLEDGASEAVRALTVKAVALISLGQFESAATTLELAARQVLPEDRFEDLLEVAQLQACLGEAHAALTTLERVSARGDDARTYFIRFLAARSLSDSKAEQLALAALIDRSSEAPAQAQRALLLTGDLDAAASLLIDRLSNPERRSAALLELQQMNDQIWPEARLDWRTQAGALTTRNDIREMLSANGGTVAVYEIFRWN